MIEICRHNGGFKIEGHAGYAPHGQDIVCAAVSALTQAFVESVDELTTDKIKADMAQGVAFVSYENLTANAKLLEDSLFIGLRMIADTYPEYVQLTVQA